MSEDEEFDRAREAMERSAERFAANMRVMTGAFQRLSSVGRIMCLDAMEKIRHKLPETTEAEVAEAAIARMSVRGNRQR